MRLLLKAIEGPHQGLATRLEPAQQQVVVGRYKRHADIVLSGDGTLSRRHFMLSYVNNGWQLRDLQSRNGTLLNGQSVDQEQLRDGDRIRAGASIFSVELLPPQAPLAAAVPLPPTTPAKLPVSTTSADPDLSSAAASPAPAGPSAAFAEPNDSVLSPLPAAPVVTPAPQPPAVATPPLHPAVEDWLQTLQQQAYQAEAQPPRSIQLRDHDGTQLQLQLDTDGRAQSVCFDSGRVWQRQYGSDGLDDAVVYPNGLQLSVSDDRTAQALQINVNNDTAVSLQYNTHGQPLRLDYGNTQSTSTVLPQLIYDDQQRLCKLIRGSRQEIYRYTDKGELCAIETSPLDNSSNDGEEVSDTPMLLAKFDYTTHDRPSQARYADGRRFEFRYDDCGRLQQIDGSLQALLRYADAETGGDAITATPLRAIEFAADDNTLTRRYDYRTINAKLCLTAAEADHNDGSDNNATTALRVEFSYDERGRLDGESLHDETIGYRYAVDGDRLLGLVYPEQRAIALNYDDDGRIVSLDDWAGAAWRIEYSHQPGAYRLFHPNGLCQHDDFDALGRISAQRLLTDAAQTLFASHYHYDECGRLTGRDDQPGGVRRYRYDAAGRLCEAHQESDDDSPQHQQTFRYDATGRLSIGDDDSNDDGDETPQATGRLDDIVIDERRWTLSYDAGGQLSGAACDDQQLHFRYDAFGRRVEKTLSVADGTSTRWRYYWAGALLLSELQESDGNATRRDFFYLPGSETAIAVRVNGELYSLHSDATGALRAATDARARPVWTARYTAFGERSLGQQEITLPLAMGGHYYDDETGLSLHHGRYYAPSLGRYVTPDRHGLLNGSDVFAYAQNDPLNPQRLRRPWRWPASAEEAARVAVEAALIVAAPQTPALQPQAPPDSPLRLIPGSAAARLLNGELAPPEPLLTASGDPRLNTACAEALAILRVDPALLCLVFEEF